MQKDDLLMSVYIELERMFTILSARKTEEELRFLLEVETAVKKTLKEFGYPFKPDES